MQKALFRRRKKLEIKYEMLCSFVFSRYYCFSERKFGCSESDESQRDSEDGARSEVVMSDWFFKTLFSIGEWDNLDVEIKVLVCCHSAVFRDG